MRTMRRTPPTQVSQRKPRAHGKRPTRATRRTSPLQPTTTRRTRPVQPARSTRKSAGRQPATRRWRLRGSGSAACYDAASGREASCDREPSAGLAAAQGERHACRANHRCIRRIACADVDASARRDRLRMQRVRSNGGTRVVRYFILRARVRIGSDEAPLLRRICVSSPVVSTRCRLLRDRVSRLEVKPSWRRGHAAPSVRIPNDFQHAVFPNSVAPHPFQGNDATHAPSSLQREIVSSAMPLVRGPISPIAAITITIAPAMNANTPTVPNPLSTAAITNDEKIAEKRLHE